MFRGSQIAVVFFSPYWSSGGGDLAIRISAMQGRLNKKREADTQRVRRDLQAEADRQAEDAKDGALSSADEPILK